MCTLKVDIKYKGSLDFFFFYMIIFSFGHNQSRKLVNYVIEMYFVSLCWLTVAIFF